MSEEMYHNESGWKCVMSQLQKTNGRDPIAYARVQQRGKEDLKSDAAVAAELKALPVMEPKFDRLKQVSP